MANTLIQTVFQIGQEGIKERMIVQYVNESGEEVQTINNYEDLTEEQKKVFNDFHDRGDSPDDEKLKALRTVFDETGNLISALHTLKSAENEIYKNMLPPLEILDEDKKKEMLKKLKDLNFLSNKNIAA